MVVLMVSVEPCEKHSDKTAQQDTPKIVVPCCGWIHSKNGWKVMCSIYSKNVFWNDVMPSTSWFETQVYFIHYSFQVAGLWVTTSLWVDLFVPTQNLSSIVEALWEGNGKIQNFERNKHTYFPPGILLL
jgi:hypothetical protein